MSDQKPAPPFRMLMTSSSMPARFRMVPTADSRRKHAAFVFESVAERDVCDVVKEGRHADCFFFVTGDRGGAAANRLNHAVSHPGCPERVLETGVHGGRKDQGCRSELL